MLHAQTDTALREDGVLYLEGNLPDKLVTRLTVPVTVYLHRDFQMVLGGFQPGGDMEILGFSTEGFLVKGSFRNNTITGWIRPEDLPPSVDKTLFTQARVNQVHHDEVAVAIANKTVVRGMTPDEVQAALGKPAQVASRTDANGSALTWIFATFREEPQYSYSMDSFGRPVMQTYYVKVPIGQEIVSFANGVVASIEQHEADPGSPGVVSR